MLKFLHTLKIKLLLPCLRDYKIIKKLGEGRYGCSYLIEDNDLKKYVLKYLKRINSKVGSKTKYEMSILSQLDHPNIPHLLKVIDKKGKMFSASDIGKVEIPAGYILEYVEGHTLAQLLYGQQYRFLNKTTWKIASQLTDILTYLQENKIVHRDIRTPNVIMNKDKIYLLDFGLARPISKKEDHEYDIDFTYLADFILYLLYSNFDADKSDKPWYDELDLSEMEKISLKKMFGIDGKYKNINELKEDIDKINQMLY